MPNTSQTTVSKGHSRFPDKQTIEYTILDVLKEIDEPDEKPLPLCLPSRSPRFSKSVSRTLPQPSARSLTYMSTRNLHLPIHQGAYHSAAETILGILLIIGAIALIAYFIFLFP